MLAEIAVAAEVPGSLAGRGCTGRLAACESCGRGNICDRFKFQTAHSEPAATGQRARQPLATGSTRRTARPRKFAGRLLLLMAALLASVCLVAQASAHPAAQRHQRRQASEAQGSTPGENDAPEAPTTSTEGPSSTTSAQPPPTTSGGRARTPAVNYTRVDELFGAVVEEQEVARRWRQMDKTLQASVGGALKLIFPHIVAMASDAKVSGSCSGAILKWILNLKNLRTWAVQMLDAIGKPSAGLLEGSLTLFGNYRQCLNIRAPDEDEIEAADGEWREYFRGQYCVLQVRPPLGERPRFYSLNSTVASLLRKSYKYYERNVYDELAELAMAFNFVSIRADLCVPSLCSRDDIQRVADFLVGKLDMRARVQRCEVQPPEDSAEWALETGHLLWCFIFVILMLLVLVSTLTSAVLKMRKRTNKSKSRSLFTSMSVYRSLSHMRNVQLERINDSKPVVLYALRIFILLWIFLVSLAGQLNFQFLRELLGLRELIMSWPMQFLVNSSLQFEALILLTAFTYSYQNINSNLADLVKYNLSKWSRLMPSVMLLVALTILTPLLYPWRSPVWHDFVQEPAQVCRSSGLVNLLFLQNFLPPSQICLPQTWLLCVELQLCLLAIPLVYLLNKTFDAQHGSFRLASTPTLLLLALALLGCFINFHNVYTNRLPAAWFLTYPDRRDRELYFGQHLHRTWAHLTTFAVGLFTGHLCRCQSIETFSGRPYGRRCCDNLMWLSAGLLMAALIFGTHSWSLSGVSHVEAPLLSAAYAALAPLLWAVAMSLVLFQLTVPNDKNQRCSLARLLASDVNLVRLGRLSFLAYLLNPYVNTLIYAVQEQAIFSSVIMLSHTLVGNLVLTYALAFIVSALVELPCRRLFKKLLIGSRRHCTNLDIVQRQLDIRQQNQGPSHDSFLAAAQSAAVQRQQMMLQADGRKQKQSPLTKAHKHQQSSLAGHVRR